MNPLTDKLFDFLKENGYTHPPYLYGKTFKGHVPYSGPFFDDNEIKAALNSILFGQWTVSGENTVKFEREFSRYLGQAQTVMVNSGSSADLLMVAAAKKRFGWKDHDEIVVSPCGFPTSISAITLNNLKPAFVDIEWGTLNFDMDAVEEYVSDTFNNSRVRAILVSPVLGNPPDFDRLVRLREKYGVKILLDGCDSLGSTWRGKHLAHYADASTCSLYVAHHISTLSGGTISSNDEELITIARSMSNWGRGCICSATANLSLNGCCGKRFSCWLPEYDGIVDHRYVYSNIGYNLQPIDMCAAIGLEQLKKLPEIHAKRQYAFDRIARMFASTSIPARQVEVLSHAEVSWFGYAVILPDKHIKTRLVAHLEQNKVQTRNYFAGNILLHEPYAHLGYLRDYPNANQVLDRVFWLGVAPFYTEEHFSHIESVIKSFAYETK